MAPSLDSSETVIAAAGPRPADAEPLAAFAGRYEVLGTLGRGGMGTVYRARDTLVGDVVALKVLEVGEGPGQDLMERFRNEVRLARRISHPHVARTHDLGEHQGRLFLTMELVEGEDLQALLARERALAPGRAARIALAVCEGLAAAHAAGVVHRDLKPANVLVEARGRVVLTDFGIARALSVESSARTQGLVGTPMYMAPEQLAGGEVDARADLYATGLLLYEMLTGQPPFSGESPMAVAFARLRQPPPDPRARAAVPDALAELVLRCAAREAQERPSGALELAAALRGWLLSVGEPVEAPQALSTPRPGALGTGPLPMPTSSSTGPVTQPGPRQTQPGASGTQTGPGELALAVLPLRFLGPREQEFLGDTMTEGLIDVLSRTRALRVQGSGATARFRTERDARVVGRELGVAVVVDGMVQSQGSQVRAQLRLVEVASGVQLWSGRFEEAGEDVFALQDTLGQRMAEALRRELLIHAWREAATPELLAVYRKGMAQAFLSVRTLSTEVIQPLEEALASSPDFLPALALHALVCIRAWFMGLSTEEHDFQALARSSVERAVRRAPKLAETHLARAMLATQDGQWREAVLALRASLDAAPTFAAAQQYLGTLQCEAGQADEGLGRLRLALALEPTHILGLIEFARCNAMRGAWEDYRRSVEQLKAQPLMRLPMLVLRLRVAGWSRDWEEVRRCLEELLEEPGMRNWQLLRYARALLGETDGQESLDAVEEMLARGVSPRFASIMCQLATEQLCLTEQPERAMGYLRRAADTALIDLEWLDRCPALSALRALPGFAEERRKVRARVQAIWTA